MITYLDSNRYSTKVIGIDVDGRKVPTSAPVPERAIFRIAILFISVEMKVTVGGGPKGDEVPVSGVDISTTANENEL